MEIPIERKKLTYSVPEMAKVLGISADRAYRLVKTKGFPTVKIGKRLLVSVAGLESWVDEQAKKGWYLA